MQAQPGAQCLRRADASNTRSKRSSTPATAVHGGRTQSGTLLNLATASSVTFASEPAAASRPSAAAAAAFVVQARKIAPRIVGDDERIATRGANTCTSLTDGRPVEQAVDQAVQRFSSGSYTVTRAEAAQLVEAARSTVCKT